MKKLTFWKSLFLLCALIVGSSNAWGQTTTYTFTTAKWADSSSSWTSDNDGQSYQASIGDGSVQVTAGYTGAGATSKNSFSNITSIKVNAATTSKGVGNITVKVGSGSEQTICSLSKNQTFDDYELNFNTAVSGTVTFVVNCSTNSLYLHSISITTSNGGGSAPSISVAPSSVNATAEGGSSSIDVTYYNIDDPDAEVLFYDSDGTTPATYSWLEAGINLTDNTKLDYEIIANTGAARTAYMKVHEKNEDVYSPLITITQAKKTVNYTYNLAQAIIPGRHYIIASGTNGPVKAMGAQNGTSYRDKVDVSASNGSITVSNEAGVYEILIEANEEKGYYTLYDVANEKYLYANSTSTNNTINIETSLDDDDNGIWSIEIDDNGVATIIAQGTSTKNWLRYNSGSPRFSCYGSTSNQADVYLFEKEGDTGSQNVSVSIAEACTDGDKYYGTYSSPFGFIIPDGLTVEEIGINNEGKLDVQAYEAGARVPANTGVMISSSTAGSKTLTLAGGGTSVMGDDNCLRATGNGMTADDMDEDNTLFYRLTMHNGTQIGFWWGAVDGGAFALGANKAYLAVPTGVNAREGFTFDNTATGINGVEEIAPVTKTRKVVKNGRLVIETANGEFAIDGARVK